MRRAGIISIVLVTACTHVQVSGSSNTGASTVTSGAAGVQVQGGAALGVVLLTGVIISASTSPTFSEWWRGQRAPELNPARTISEQDCTKPIELSGNLKCR